MAMAQRFLFDECFDGKLSEEAAAASTVVEFGVGEDPAFTESELEAARRTAYAEGHAAGLAEGRETAATEFRDAAENRLAAVGEHISARLDEIAAAQSGLRARFEADAVLVATSLVQRVVPRILREAAEVSVTAVIDDVLPRLLNEPKIAVHVADGLLEPIRARLQRIKAQSRFGGEFIVLADPALSDFDCRLEWTDGGVDVSHERLWAQIETALNDLFAAYDAASATVGHADDGAEREQ